MKIVFLLALLLGMFAAAFSDPPPVCSEPPCQSTKQVRALGDPPPSCSEPPCQGSRQ